MTTSKEQKSEPKQYAIASWRFLLVLGAFASLMLLIVLRLTYLHTIEQPFLFDQGEKRTLRSEVQHGMRGMITDRFGEPLAISTPVVDIWLNPRQVESEAIPAIAKALKLSEKTLRVRVEKAAKAKQSFMYIKRQVEPDEASALLKMRIAGVNGESNYRRFYPAGEVTAHTVGIVNVDGRGQEGLELAYDAYLQGHDGSRQVVKDIYGNFIKQTQVKEVATQGGNLTLTLDLRLQYLAYRELMAAVNQHHAASGSAVMLDAKTGEVLALVSQPSYNPNNRVGLKPEAMRNRAVADLIEPGSTIKPFTVAAALTSGEYGAHTPIDTAPGFIRVKNKAIRDHRNYGVLDVTGVITKSSNVGVTKIAHHLGAQSIWEFFTQAGIGQASVLGFPGEAISQMPYPEQLDALRLATVSYGYGVALSPLHLAYAYTNFTQEGCHKPLQLVVENRSGSDCQQVMPEKVAKQVLAMLETVLSKQGTGSRAQVNGYRAGGKTGTAHRVGRKGYEDSSYTAVFAGIAPISNPDLVLVVVIDDPKGKEYYGGEVAAPVFSRIMEQALHLRQIAPDDGSVQTLQLAGGKQ
ncbi:MAG: penicillin-binding transpeptidase domain-containing protein [Venatoribacter sp.]